MLLTSVTLVAYRSNTTNIFLLQKSDLLFHYMETERNLKQYSTCLKITYFKY
jgi:hypothetical protein